MKQEVKDIAMQAVMSSPTSMWAVLTQVSLASWIAIALGTLQAAYLIRKWWREETEWGIRLKRWAQNHGITKPAELE